MDILQRKRKLVNNISSLDNNEKRHIFHILKKNGVSFTKNKNGYFFNFTNIQDNMLVILERCVDVIITHRMELQILDKKRDLQIKEFKETISKTMKEKLIKKAEDEFKMIKLVREETSISKNITQKITIRKRVIDPDTIENEMKKMNKLPKYEKNTVYWRISQKISTRAKNVKNKREDAPEIEIDKIDAEDDLDYSDELSHDDKLSDTYDDIEDDDDLDNLGNCDDENEDNEDNEDEDDENEEIEEEDINDENEIIVEDHEEVKSKNQKEKADKKNAENEEFNAQYLHFKSLLKSKGFNCLENVYKLKEESYLELDEEMYELKQI